MLNKINSIKILRVFFKTPEGKFHIRQLSRITKISAPGLLKILKKLISEGILVSEKSKIARYISASKSENFIHMKRVYNLYAIYESGLIEFIRKEYEEPECVVLFGSYARGEDISKSDIDIAVITKLRKNSDTSQFSSLKRKIDVHEINPRNSEKEFLNTLSNGIVLYGYLKVVR